MQWPCRLAEHEKADIVLRFRRNLNDFLNNQDDPSSKDFEPKDDGMSMGESSWERATMDRVHRDIMTAFEHKVRDSVDQWFQIPPKAPATHSKREEDQYEPYARDDNSVQRILDEMHQDVLDAFDRRVQDDLRKQKNAQGANPRGELPGESAKKQQRVIRTRNLKKILQDFDACASDPACNLDTEDFVKDA
jgi:hypothetical protein